MILAYPNTSNPFTPDRTDAALKTVNTQVLFLAAILVATIFEVIGDILLKLWAVNNGVHLLLLGLITYYVGIVFWALSLQYDYLSRAISIIVILNLILVVLVGVVMFKEQLSLVSKIGIGLGILSVVLLELG